MLLRCRGRRAELAERCLGDPSHTRVLFRFLYFSQECDFASEIIKARQSLLQMGSDSHLKMPHTCLVSDSSSLFQYNPILHQYNISPFFIWPSFPKEKGPFPLGASHHKCQGNVKNLHACPRITAQRLTAQGQRAPQTPS